MRGIVLGGRNAALDFLTVQMAIELPVLDRGELLGEQVPVHLLALDEEVVGKPAIGSIPPRGIGRHEADVARGREASQAKRRLGDPMANPAETLGAFVGALRVHPELRLDRLGSPIHSALVRGERPAHLCLRRVEREVVHLVGRKQVLVTVDRCADHGVV